MPRAKNKSADEAFALYRQGVKLKDIAERLAVPEGTVRRWKCIYHWESERSEKKKANETNEKANVRKKREYIKNDKEKAIAEEVEQVIENPELTDKQRLFCLYYIRCFNATKAYQKAYGCSYDVANAEGYKFLVNPCIREEIQRLKQNRLNREMLSEADIFQKYMDIAFADITDYLTFGRQEVPVMGPFGQVKVTDPVTGEKVEATKMVNVVQFRESGEVDGTLISEVRQGKDGASIKLADRMKALQWIAEHMDLATVEQKARIEVLKSQVRQKDDTKEQAQDWKAAVIEIAKRRSEKMNGRTD